jgi:hypothetical protein
MQADPALAEKGAHMVGQQRCPLDAVGLQTAPLASDEHCSGHVKYMHLHSARTVPVNKVFWTRLRYAYNGDSTEVNYSETGVGDSTKV